MQLTTDYLKRAFIQYNKEIFHEELPLPILKISNAKHRLGSMHYKWKIVKGKEIKSFTIVISNYYNVPENIIEDTLIHEMIHYEIAYKGLKDTAAHGRLFREKMNYINKEFNRNISIRKSMEGFEARNMGTRKTYLVLAQKMKNGKKMVTSVSRTAARKLIEDVKHIKEIAEYTFYVSDNPYFQHFPMVRTLRAHEVSNKEYNDLIADMIPVYDKNGWVEVI